MNLPLNVAIELWSAALAFGEWALGRLATERASPEEAC